MVPWQPGIIPGVSVACRSLKQKFTPGKKFHFNEVDVCCMHSSGISVFMPLAACTREVSNQRQGTHKSKQRGELAGSTMKIKRQTGTGTARDAR